MSQCQQQNIHQNPQMHAGCCQRLGYGCNRVNAASAGFFGGAMGANFGPLANQGLFGANNFGFNANNWGGFNSMNSLFQPPFGGGNFGYQPPFQYPGGGVSAAVGISINL